MHIAWGSLLNVLLVSFAAATAVVVLVSTSLVALSGKRSKEREGENEPVTTRDKAVAGTCLFAAALIVIYALYVIVAA